MHLKLLSAIAAPNGAPSLATHGVPLRRGALGQIGHQGFNELSGQEGEMFLGVNSTAGSGVITLTGSLWGYQSTIGKWYSLGAITALAETSADAVNSAERILDKLDAFDRVYFEALVFGGTAPAFDVYLFCRG
jgi:hypothetical protein